MALPRVVLVFGESDNDRESLRQLFLALRPDAVRVEKRRNPTVLVRGREAALARRNLVDMASVARADSKRLDIQAIVVHQDCDGIEPAHIALAQTIVRELSSSGFQTVAATPAWEIEAWWFLWPDSVLSVSQSWQSPRPPQPNIGRVIDAKEALRRAVRRHGRRHRRDYQESDSITIATHIRMSGSVRRTAPGVQSDSWRCFVSAVSQLAL